MTRIQACYPYINLGLFKLSWILLVVWQSSAVWPALVLLAISLGLHRSTWSAACCAVCIAVAGMMADQLLAFAGVFVFASATLPLWLAVLWLHFGVAVPTGFRFLQKTSLWTQALIGALAGPSSYWAGSLNGAVGFGKPLFTTLAILALLWLLLLPVLIRIGSGSFSRSMPHSAFLLMLLASVGMNNKAAAQPALVRLGQAEYRVLIWKLYKASLSASSAQFTFPGTVPFVLSLEYQRAFSKQQLVAETLKQWRLQGIKPSAGWEAWLDIIFPDVQSGDIFSLYVDAEYVSHFSLNNASIGSISDAGFSQALAGIWLATNTTSPEFRQQLLGVSR